MSNPAPPPPGTPAPVRVLLVDDSPVALMVLQNMLADSPHVEVVGTARHGQEALEMMPTLLPQVVCLDLHMPVMDGLELTRQIMARFPRPILVVSSTVDPEDRDKVFPLLQAGAIDVFAKPTGALASDPQTIEQLISKIRLLARVPVFTRPLRTSPSTSGSGTATVSRAWKAGPTTPRAIRLVAIGASTGGPQTLQTILSKLPANFRVPILCVQHISPGFLQGLVDWLNTQCPLRVQIARSGAEPQPGVIYFPQEGTHLELDRQGRLTATTKPPVDGHRPSVSVTFHAVARYYSDAALAVLLTGMGRDGAEGLLKVAQAGGVTIAQDEASSVVFGMPKQGIELGAARHILPAAEIAQSLIDYVQGDK